MEARVGREGDRIRGEAPSRREQSQLDGRVAAVYDVIIGPAGGGSVWPEVFYEEVGHVPLGHHGAHKVHLRREGGKAKSDVELINDASITSQVRGLGYHLLKTSVGTNGLYPWSPTSSRS